MNDEEKQPKGAPAAELASLKTGSVHGSPNAKGRKSTGDATPGRKRVLPAEEDGKHPDPNATSAKRRREPGPVGQSGAGDAPISVNQATGLNFPIALSSRALREGGYSKKVGPGAPIYLTAVLEYLTTEVLDLASNIAKAADGSAAGGAAAGGAGGQGAGVGSGAGPGTAAAAQEAAAAAGAAPAASGGAGGAKTITPQHLQFLLSHDAELREVVAKLGEEDEEEDEDDEGEDDEGEEEGEGEGEGEADEPLDGGESTGRPQRSPP